MARRPQKKKFSKKQLKAQRKIDAQPVQVEQASLHPVRAVSDVPMGTTITVSELARRSGRPAAEIVGALLQNGVIATVNDSIDRDTVEIISEDLAIRVVGEESISKVTQKQEERGELTSRPPVVTVMGHVDHGKTTLLDSIRQANVAVSESGGITQHIGAYQVVWHGKRENENRPITFVDTPGHEAFSALRAHGASITDIVILVVAADDGVKPQTKEALSHARAANVPIIVAINKIDKPGANIDRVKGQLVELGLNPEDWGGKTPVIPVSAKSGEGIDDLLDTVLLVADLSELAARSYGTARGVIIESHMQPGVGPLATLLVQHGELQVGDMIVAGTTWGRVRFMEDEHGVRHQSAGPSVPVRVAGLSGVPMFGTQVGVVATEKIARMNAQNSVERNGSHRAVLDETEGGSLHLSIILKADVGGSVEAIRSSLAAIQIEGVEVRFIHDAVGDLTESDVNLAMASAHSLLLAFRTNVTTAAKNLARLNGLAIHPFDVIYELIEYVENQAKLLREPKVTHKEIGRLKVMGVFRTTKTDQIIGGRVEQGEIRVNANAQILRDDLEISTGIVRTLQRGQTPAQQINVGEECGLSLQTSAPAMVGDMLILSIEESV